MNDNALAISETTKPKRTGIGGCVGIFFQLFDWNRSFSKNKLFSKRLLPPGRGKESSKKFGGDEKLPKLRLIADENSGGFPNGASSSLGKSGVQTPSLVARLMGLESMPSVKRDKLLTQEVVGDNGDFVKETTRQESRPQKLQKTGIVDTKTVTRFGSEALQLKNVLSRSRKHHHPKLASPVKTTSRHSRTGTSRLVGAATRILEPGLQSRKSKYAITYYAHSIRTPRTPNDLRSDYMKNGDLDLSKKHASCKNCGNLVDITESSPLSKRDLVSPSHGSPNGNSRYNIDQEHGFSTNTVPIDHGRQPQRFASATDVSDTKDFVTLNRTSLNGRTRPRVPTKVEDTKFDTCSFSGQKRQLKQGESYSTNIPRMVSSSTSATKSTGKRMGSEPSGRLAGDGMAFRFNSPTKNRCEVPTKVDRKRNQNVSPSKTFSRKKYTLNHQSNEKPPFHLTGDSLGALLEKKLHELTSLVEYESGINGSQPKKTPANNFQELIRALHVERSLNQNNHRSRYDHKTSFCLKPKSEKAGELTRDRNSNHLSPGSVLEASFSNDSCCSSSLEDSSVRTQHADSITYSYDPFSSGVFSSQENTHNQLAAGLLSYISKVLHSIDVVNPRNKGNIHAHLKEVIFYSELVLGNQNEKKYFFICDLLLELDTLVEIMWTRFGNFFGSRNLNAGYQLKRFVFDALIEYLDSKYVHYSKCGFRTWSNHPPSMGSGVFIHEVVKEVRGWIGDVGVTSDDELVEMDLCHSLGRWTDFEIEGYEIGAEIAGDVLQMLVHEIVVDLFTGPMI